MDGLAYQVHFFRLKAIVKRQAHESLALPGSIPVLAVESAVTLSGGSPVQRDIVEDSVDIPLFQKYKYNNKQFDRDSMKTCRFTPGKAYGII